jgi:TolB protein
MKLRFGLSLILLCALAALPFRLASQQDWFRTGTGLGVEKVRLALPSFTARSAEVQTAAGVFNSVLWNDLEVSGILEMVSPSFFPLEAPTRLEELRPQSWASPPANAHMVAYGSLQFTQDQLVVDAWLSDVRNPQAPPVIAKRYRGNLTEDEARRLAHQFADDIIERLSGGLPGIARTQIAFVSDRTGNKEIWVMDYDGANQRQLTRYNSITRDPAVTLDGAKLAYMSYVSGNPDIYVQALDTGRRLPFRSQKGLNATPAWSPDGSKVVFCASYPGDTELFLGDANGGNLRRLTNSRGVDIEPAWNPKTGAQIAFVSGRGGLPQIYLMDSDGSNVRRLTPGTGEAVNPTWSPNGQVLAFAWTRGFAPGNYNIFVMDVASGRLVQLTHGEGRNEHPSWAPDGRHIVFESNRGGRKQIYTMLVDGTQVRALTSAGANEAPVWGTR